MKGMPMEHYTSFYVSVFSPRWGHDDDYSFGLRDEEMSVVNRNAPAKKATCTQDENGCCEWTGHRNTSGNPLVNILADDSIFPPSVFVYAVEAAWRAWADGRLDDKQVRKEVQLLFDWVSWVTQKAPKSDFWRGVL